MCDIIENWKILITSSDHFDLGKHLIPSLPLYYQPIAYSIVKELSTNSTYGQEYKYKYGNGNGNGYGYGNGNGNGYGYGNDNGYGNG